MKVLLARDYIKLIAARHERAIDLCAAVPANIHLEYRCGQLAAIQAEAEAISDTMLCAADSACAPVYSALRRRLVAIEAEALALLDDMERIA